MPVQEAMLTTTRFGSFAIDKKNVIEFPKGLLGFEAHTRFYLIDDPDYHPFAHLQAMDDPELAFTVVNPKLFFPHYKVQVDRQEIADLEVDDVCEVNTWVIVTVPEDIDTMSANLQGPILINSANNCGKQVVLVRSPYTTRHYLMDELQKQSASKEAKSRKPVTA